MKIKAFAAVLMAGVMAAAMAVTGFAAGNAGPGAAGAGQKLPAFRYVDDAPYMNAILDYMTETEARNFEAGDVMIPNFVIMGTDETNPDDIKVWGNFWVMNYDLEGDNLMMKNGGENPGLLHLKKTGTGYTVTGADMVGDGSNNAPDARRIFGTDEKLMRFYQNQDLVVDRNRADTIRRYVIRNGLNINSFQDYGWDKVMLK